MEGITILPLEVRVNLEKTKQKIALAKYRIYTEQYRDRRFVDLTHDPLGNMCRLFYNTKTKKYDFEKIEK